MHTTCLCIAHDNQQQKVETMNATNQRILDGIKMCELEGYEEMPNGRYYVPPQLRLALRLAYRMVHNNEKADDVIREWMQTGLDWNVNSFAAKQTKYLAGIAIMNFWV